MNTDHAVPTARRATVVDRGTESRLAPVALGVLLVGFALSVIDFFIVNVALPTMGTDLHVSAGELELVVSVYAAAYAMFLVLGGRLGDLLGRRRLFLAGMGGFTLASLAAGLAPSAAMLIAARALQGVAAAMLVPQVLATIHATTDGIARARAVGRYGATASIGMVAGQVLGGAIVALNLAGSGWRGIFLFNVPIGVAGLLLAGRQLPATRSEHPMSLDPFGAGLLGLALFGVLLSLSQGAVLGWPAWSWALLGIAGAAGAGFVIWERHCGRVGHDPLVPAEVIIPKSMRAAVAVAVPFFIAFGGFMFVYALVSQDTLHLRALTAAAMLVPFAIGLCVTSLYSHVLIDRLGAAAILVGAIAQIAVMATITAITTASWPHPPAIVMEILFALLGLAEGCVFAPLFRIGLSDVPTVLAGAGSGVLTTTQQVSLALGATALGTLYTALQASSTAAITVAAVAQAGCAVLTAGAATRLTLRRCAR